jgi:hypothetical protein
MQLIHFLTILIEGGDCIPVEDEADDDNMEAEDMEDEDEEEAADDVMGGNSEAAEAPPAAASPDKPAALFCLNRDTFFAGTAAGGGGGRDDASPPPSGLIDLALTLLAFSTTMDFTPPSPPLPLLLLPRSCTGALVPAAGVLLRSVFCSVMLRLPDGPPRVAAVCPCPCPCAEVLAVGFLVFLPPPPPERKPFFQCEEES